MREQAVRVADQPVHESELVGIFLARRRIAVGEVNASEPQHAARGGDDRLDVARLGVVRVARQAALDLPLKANSSRRGFKREFRSTRLLQRQAPAEFRFWR